MRVLPSGSPLVRPDSASVSVLSWNVLMPNSRDGWWLYKYYPPSVPTEATRWDARRELLSEAICSSKADIVCLQECSPLSFASDFKFLFEAGYTAAIHGKGRMRPATFWRSDRLRLCAPDGARLAPDENANEEDVPTSQEADRGKEVAVAEIDQEEAASLAELERKRPGVLQGDRTITCSFRILNPDGSDLADCPPLWVTNCHLTAGPEARRRLRQVHEALEAIRKARDNAGVGKAPKGSSKAVVPGAASGSPNAACIVCGDMNSQGSSAVQELLVAGEVLPSFRESGDETERNQEHNEVTSKPKRQTLGKFANAYADVGVDNAQRYASVDGNNTERDVHTSPPPTIYSAALAPAMETEEDGSLSEALTEALTECFFLMSGGLDEMSSEATREWLIKINGSPDRGSESRSAAACRAANGKDSLSLDDFLTVYKSELAQGKYWGIEADLRVMRGVGLWIPGSPPFCATFDQLYYMTSEMALHSVLEPIDGERLASLRAGITWLPNEWAPSDHLPIGAVFTLTNA